MTKDEQIIKLKKELTHFKRELKMWKKAANSWMNDFDVLKEKYEPLVVVESRTLEDHKRWAEKRYKDQFE